MKKNSMGKRAVSLLLTAVLCAGLSTVTLAQNSYDDFDYITSHVNLKVPAKLNIVRPNDDITTSASSYFIMGSSNPQSALIMNGNQVTTRGSRGSFGVYVALDAGVNTFTFKQGDASATVNITKGAATTAATIKDIRSMSPSYDCATTAGSTINLSCIAPSGASVVATVGGRKVKLTQQAATAQKGVPATFSAKTTAGDVEGTQNLGQVTYTLNGKTNYQSAGSVYLTGSGDTLMIQVKNNSASIYKDSAQSAFIETAKLGAVDAVTDMTGSLYKLSSGGWIPKDSVQPLTKKVSYKNKVSDVSFVQEKTGESFVLDGTTYPMFRAYQTGEALTVKLFNTTGINDLPIGDSSLFTDVNVTVADGDTTLSFQLGGDRKLMGYLIEYGDGKTTIYCKYKPVLQSGSKPLTDVTIMVDAGHGGTDPGALGIPWTDGAMEKDINLAAAIAVQKRLESLGATVLMTRDGDSNPSMNERIQMTQDARADMFISMHSNSVGYETDANRPSGTEVYYFEGISQKLATSIAANVASYTGRTARGAKVSNYRVTLNSFAPSVLVEMGFLTNPVEYDSMTSRKGIFNTANAVGDSVLAALK